VQSQQSIFWLGSAGKPQPLHPAPGLYGFPRFSPDGKRLAFTIYDNQGHQDIWVRDLEREATSRLTFLSGPNEAPVWTPDSANIVFFSSNSTAPGIYSTRADGSGEPQRLADGKARMLPHSISPDNKRLAGIVPLVSGGTEIWTAPLEGDGDSPRLGKPETFLRSPFIKLSPTFSPDGRWVDCHGHESRAYSSNESGTGEVYVRPFPGPGGGGQISTGGGSHPIWSRNGRELFFRGADARIMVVAYTVRGGSFMPGKPRVWSDQRLVALGSPPFPKYDLAPDGKRFAVVLYADGSVEPKPITHLTFILNFFDELQRRVPTGGK